MVFPSTVAAAPAQAATSSVTGSVFSTALSLIVVLAVIFALAWLLRWMQGARVGSAGALRINGGLQVGTKERVLLVQAGDRHLLIGVAPGQVNTLHVFEHAPVRATADPIQDLSPFAERLRQLLQPKSSS